MIAGSMFITPHAVRRYRERVPSARRLTYEQALAELIRLTDAVRPAKPLSDGSGAWIFRGPPPLRLRLVVAPPRTAGEAPQVVTVLPLYSPPSSANPRQ